MKPDSGASMLVLLDLSVLFKNQVTVFEILGRFNVLSAIVPVKVRKLSL